MKFPLPLLILSLAASLAQADPDCTPTCPPVARKKTSSKPVAAASMVPAGPTALRSPQVATTYADGAIFWHQLRWLPHSQELVATITFNNMAYVSEGEMEHNETFDFPLPGVKFDPATNAFYIRDARGQSIQIATLRKSLLGHTVELSPTAQMLVTHHSSRVDVSLIANRSVRENNGWVENHL